ncbi:hypothetical protein BDV95DRAFT_663363 [Massariosphaeria phaeospora]|uniref:Cora-like Mg2+ transporter protein-domain-containing protein n=1 Tax=Massariosphaeria phaeospora TaxID=100035 RepID=A0A7C8IIN8_9PLEO|nr:hypothetical protein BDV95DRAFT_663363 [Massariosphaeria phaeospora]
MAASNHQRSMSDPLPPITVEDTANGTEPRPSPSPTHTAGEARSFSAYDANPQHLHQDPRPRRLQRRNTTWGHRRKNSPGVEWHDKWTKDSWKQGRVLLIDYVAKEYIQGGKRKIVAQEFGDIDSLRRFYKNQDLSQQSLLRVIHVQNAKWATRFLLRKFNIDAQDDLVGTNFGKWAAYEKPQQRGGKPVFNGKSFRAQRDPWRGISRTAFGCDYLRHYDKDRAAGFDRSFRMMELNHYDDEDQPSYAFDVYLQRLSVYIQLSDGVPGEPVDEDVRNPYDEEQYEQYEKLKKQYAGVDANGNETYIPKLKTLDNGSTIILFENAESGSVKDVLIQARQEIEQRWRRLTFYLRKEEIEHEDKLVLECMDLILRDIFKALSYNWEKYINICETHVGILEDKIYENPADESRAPELWTNSSLWLKVERLMYMHSDVAREMRDYLKEVAQETPDHPNSSSQDPAPWLGSASDDLDKLIVQFQEGVLKPTDNLSDLMYKSVGIRDARHSLQLSLSMWRLSWITFIFLPLTFVSGFFGMNVDTFAGNPSIKWWFIAVVPLFALVIVSWLLVKHTLAAQRQNPLRRGVYETLYHDLAARHPALWTRRGARAGVVPVGWWSGVKWRLITAWFTADRTSLGKAYDAAAADEELSTWSRAKRYLATRWLDTLPVMPSTAALTNTATTAATAPPHSDSAFDVKDDLGAVGALLTLATPIALADADPTAASRLQRRYPSLSPTRSDDGRPGSSRASGVMVDEKSEDGGSADERESGGSGGSGGARGRLSVPLAGGAGMVNGVL